MKNRSLVSLLLRAENAGKCPLGTQHRLVKAHSTERSLFSGHHSLPIRVASAMCRKCVLRIVYLTEVSSFLDHCCKLIAWKSRLKHSEKGPLS